MAAPVDQGPVSKRDYPLFCMAFLANIYCDLSYDISWILSLCMAATRAMAGLASCVFQFWGLLKANKAARLAISCRMASIANLNFICGKSLFHLQHTLK